MPQPTAPQITPATPQDLAYIVSLSKDNAESLGFLTREAMGAYVDRQRVTIAHENDDPCGYFLTSRRDRADVRIFQACVQLDARGLAHGLHLLADLVTEAALNGTSQISLHCRDGLDSNAFWSACGFQLSSIIPGGHTRRRCVNIWTLPIQEALHLPNHPYGRRYLGAILHAQAPAFPRTAAATAACSPPSAGSPKWHAHPHFSLDLPAPVDIPRILTTV